MANLGDVVAHALYNDGRLLGNELLRKKGHDGSATFGSLMGDAAPTVPRAKATPLVITSNFYNFSGALKFGKGDVTPM